MQGSILLHISGKKKTIRSLFLVFILSLVFPLVLTPIAQAAAKYGPIASPGTAWRDDIVLNGQEGRQSPYPEMTSIDCKDPATGKPLTSEQLNTIKGLAQSSTEIFFGEFKAEDKFGDISLDNDEDFKEKTNYGMKSGKAGMNAFLRGEKELLNTTILPKKTEIDPEDISDKFANAVTNFDPTKGYKSITDLINSQKDVQECNSKACARSAWNDFEKRSLTTDREKAADHGATYPWSGKALVDIDGSASDAWTDVGEYTDTWKMSPEEGKSVANMINANATVPQSAFAKVPAGCPLVDWNTSDGLGLGDFFDNIARGFASLLLAVPSMIIDTIYNLVYPAAWKYAFYTPHTERGDTIFNMETTCSKVEGNSCSGYKELGFTKNNLDGSGGKDKPMFLKLTSMIQWMLSGTYFLILFASAVLFIFRGSRSQTLQLMKVGPRLAFVLMFTFATPFLMGAVISLSNLIVMSILGFNQPGGASGSLAQVSMTANLMGAFFSESGSDNLIYPIVKFITGLAATVASVMVLASAYIRQIILIILVVSAPIAVFCLIVDSWKPHFKRWLRIFFIVAFFPVVLGIILKVGIFINPLMGNLQNLGQGDAITGFVMLIIMFWAMGRSVKMAQGMMGNPGGGGIAGVGNILGKLGQGANRIPVIGGAAGMALGAAGYGLGRASQAPSGLKEALVPAGRGSMSGTPLLGGGANPNDPNAPSMTPGGKLKKSLGDRFNNFAEKGASEKARRAALRKDKFNDWMNGNRKVLGTTGPRDWIRKGAGKYSPKMIADNRFLGPLVDKAKSHSRTIDAAQAENMINARNNFVQEGVRSGLSRREAERRAYKAMGGIPQKQADGTYRIQEEATQHQANREKSALRAAQAAFEQGRNGGDKAELVRNIPKYKNVFDGATGKEVERRVGSEKALGADYDEFAKFLKDTGQYKDLSDSEIQKLVEKHASDGRR